MVAPTSTTSDLVEFDALRGLAVLGVAWMSIYAFALPPQAFYNPVAFGGEGAADRLVWVANFVFAEDKFRALFALAFGAACLASLETVEDRRWRANTARMAVLLLIGVLHAVLFANNDALRSLAIAGLALPILAQLSHRALYAVAIGFVAVHFGAGMVVFGSAVVDHYVGRSGSDAALFAERNFGLDQPAIRAALEEGRESFGERIARTAPNAARQLWIAAGALPFDLAAVTLGMALWKDRMLTREWRTFRMQRLAAICAVIAIPALLALAWWVSSAGFPGALAGAVSIILSAPFDMLLALSYAALAMAFFHSSGVITRVLAAVGKLWLSNYLMSSVVLAALFAGWGLGLFGEVSRIEVLTLGLVPIAAMLLWSGPWIARFGQGPFERMWSAAGRHFA